MSGGSFNYLYGKSAEDLMTSTEDLLQMVDELEELGAHDVAADTKEVLTTILTARKTIDVASGKLSAVWKAVEWWKSHDRSRDTVDMALERYRMAKGGQQ